MTRDRFEPNGISILIVEDDDDVRELLVEKFRHEGFHVVNAVHGEQGIAALEKHQPALILTDIVMPTMGGLDFIRKVRERHKHLPIIAISGMSSSKFEAISLGVTHFIDKPFDGRTLSDIVRNLLEMEPPVKKVG